MKNNKKVVMILAEPCHNDSRVMREAKTLTEAGYELVILAIWRKGLKRMERRDGYIIKRLCCFGGDKSLLKEIFKNIIFGVSIFARIICIHPVVCHIHNIRPLLPAYLAARLAGAKVIYDSHELWEGVAYRQYYPKILFNLLLCLEKVLGHRVDMVVTVSMTIAKILRRKFKNRVALIRNVSSIMAQPASNILRKKFELVGNHDPLIIYQGIFSEVRGCLNLIKAMSRVKGLLVFMGSGDRAFKSRMRKMIRDLDLSGKVFIHGVVPANMVGLYTHSADYGVHTIVDTCPNHKYCLPNKLFSYLMAGQPVAVSNLPDMGGLVHKYGVGVTFDPTDPDDIAEKLNTLLASNGVYEQNIARFNRVFNWKREGKRMLKIYETLLSI